MEQQETELTGELLDLSGLTLHDLDELDDSVFASAMKASLNPDRRDSEAIAGFNSFAGSFSVD
jgi:FXSXX-COOH protein